MSDHVSLIDSLCDALLLEFGVLKHSGKYEGKLIEARGIMRPHATEVIDHLRDDGWIIVRGE
jgi:hypothetical protein